MVDFFKSIFGKRAEAAKQEAPLSYEQLKGVPFNKLLTLMNSLGAETMQFGPANALRRRLDEIALCDNHVPEEQRVAAGKLARALAADLEKMLSNNPEGLALLKTEISEMRELARRGGYGSLVWRLNEYPMSGAEVIPYLMKPEHRRLVPDYLEILGPEKVGSVKHHMVRQLILQANYNSRNSVLILHGLAASGDKAAAALFTQDEYRALLNVPGNYVEGRAVLTGLGILPAAHDVGPIRPVSEIKEVLSNLQELFSEKTKRAEEAPQVANLPENRKYALLLALALLRIELARALLCQTYGKEAAYDVVTIFGDVGLIKQLDQFNKASEALKATTPGTPMDLALLDYVMSVGGIEAKSEEEWNSSHEYRDMAVAWLNTDRVEFLDSLRHTLCKSKNDSTDQQEDWIV